MGFLQNRLLRRFSFVGRLGDIALVGGLVLRVAQRQGWINDDQIARMGLAGVSEQQSLGLGELALGVGAAIRLLRRRRARNS